MNIKRIISLILSTVLLVALVFPAGAFAEKFFIEDGFNDGFYTMEEENYIDSNLVEENTSRITTMKMHPIYQKMFSKKRRMQTISILKTMIRWKNTLQIQTRIS